MKSRFNHIKLSIVYTITVLGMVACATQPKETPIFEMLDASKTGIEFANNLYPTETFNMFHYMYYYNGAGVATGDFNNDGKVDIFFASNEGRNTLYLNQGGLKFKDFTDKAKIPQDSAWNTGVSLVDINNDGLLDMLSLIHI